MHTQNFLLPLLANLSLHYPQANRTPAQLKVLAEDWAEDLAPFSEATVAQAVKQYRRESAYFPTTADIIHRCESLRREEMRREGLSALPESTRTNDEQCALNARMGKELLAMLRKNMDAKTQGRQDTPMYKQVRDLATLEATR